MPIDTEFHAERKSDFTGMVNWPNVEYGNASIAFVFFKNLTDLGTASAHFDIAGSSYFVTGTFFPTGSRQDVGRSAGRAPSRHGLTTESFDLAFKHTCSGQSKQAPQTQYYLGNIN